MQVLPKNKFAQELRHHQTDAERTLWRLLRARSLAHYKFRRQHLIAGYIVDFCCLRPRLVVELDGSRHAEQAAYDKQRTQALEDQGFTALRFWNNDALRHPDQVARRILMALEDPHPPRQTTGGSTSPKVGRGNILDPFLPLPNVGEGGGEGAETEGPSPEVAAATSTSPKVGRGNTLKPMRAAIVLLLMCVSDGAFALGSGRASDSSAPEENPVAVLGETMGESRPASPQSPALLSPDRFSFLAGGELLHAGGADQWMPAVAMRYRLEAPHLAFGHPLPWGEGVRVRGSTLIPDSVELGGALATTVSGGFHQETINFGGVSYQAHIKSMAEAHVAGVWEFCKTSWIVPELSLGLSVGRFKNEAVSPGQAGFPLSEEHTSVSQLTQLGATFPITDSIALHADAGYLRYANHLRDPANNDFNLFVSALAFRALLQARL